MYKVRRKENNIKNINKIIVGGSQMQKRIVYLPFAYFLQQSKDNVYQQIPHKWGTFVINVENGLRGDGGAFSKQQGMQ